MLENYRAHGFQGAIANLPLVDVIQLQAANRFSGLITFSSAGRVGRLYFLDGAIVHAESPGAIGERAVYALVSWPEGTFQLHPNTTTIERTIQKNLTHLLLEAHQFLDESGQGVAALATPPPRSSPPSPRPRSSSSRLDAVRELPGVAGVVQVGRDGVPIGDSSKGAEALAARGLYLAMTHAAVVGSAFGLGELTCVSLRSEVDPLLLFQSKGSFLCVALGPEAANEEVEAKVRGVLTPAERGPRGR